MGKGGLVTVTHPDMTRYFMTIKEASQLILQAGALGMGGEIFVLDMGQPVKIIDLAKHLIKLSGKNINDIGIIFTGLRPGEKMYEELFYDREALSETQQKKIFKANSKSQKNWNAIQFAMTQLEFSCVSCSQSELIKTIYGILEDEGIYLEKNLDTLADSKNANMSYA